MGWIALRLALPLALLIDAAPALAANAQPEAPTSAAAHPALAPAEIGPPGGSFELNFTKGDTREGAKLRIRIVGDSLHYSRTVFSPGREAVESYRSAPLDVRRKAALERIQGELSRFRVFDSCHGKGMRYYLIDIPGARFYRSLPERTSRCFTDEPGIWSLLDDLDTFIAPPEEPETPAGV